MKITEFDPKLVTVNTKITARKGTPDPEEVQKIALSYAQRLEKGLDHQIQPGVVRMAGGVPEVIVGNHRLEACKLYNQSRGPKDEPVMFLAVSVKSGDEDALITAIVENEYRVATNVFDRAEAMQKLVDLGKTQTEVAGIFHVSEGTVSQAMKTAKLEKKYVKAVLGGDLEEHAAILIAGLAVDDAKRQEIFEECLRHRNKFDEFSAKLETRKAKEEVNAEVEAAKLKVDELSALEKDTIQKVKDADKAVKEAAKALPKTADVQEIEAARRLQDAAIAERQKVIDDQKRLEKDKFKAQKVLDDAKKRKEKVIEDAKVTKTKVSPEDVKKAAKAAGVKAGDGTMPKLSMKAFLVGLEALGEDKSLPKSAGELLGKFQGYVDQDYTESQLANALRRYCVDDATLAAQKPPKGKKVA